MKELAQAMQPSGPNVLEIVSLVSSIVSVILAVFAIWLSLVLYRWSSQAEKEAQRAASGIMSAVHRLETLFDKLHSETFGMMKDMVTDMRNRIFPPGGKQTKMRGKTGQPMPPSGSESEDEAEDSPQISTTSLSVSSTDAPTAQSADESKEGSRNG